MSFGKLDNDIFAYLNALPYNLHEALYKYRSFACGEGAITYRHF